MEGHIWQSFGGAQSLPANCQRLPPMQRFYATATDLVIVSQVGWVRFWSKAAQHRFHADWRDQSFLELFGE